MHSTDPTIPPIANDFLDVLETMIGQQRAKSLAIARRAVPHLTADDIMNPHDFAELRCVPEFHYEDGILAGLIAAQIALRARTRERWRA
ncbi:MAG: hypothetical protein HY286_08215 [Planctomycetes bacterium]|nr:hypothetical protein [Planctomycetota bacterium]